MNKSVLRMPSGIKLTIETEHEINKELILYLLEAGVKALNSDNLFLEVNTKVI